MRLRLPEYFIRRHVYADVEGRAHIRPRTIYILPTAQGILFGAILFLMLLGSINYANNLGFMLTFLLAGLGVVAILHTWRNLVGLELVAGRNEPVFAGQEARFEIQLINHRESTRAGINIKLADGEPVACDLEGKSSEALTLAVQTHHRGYQPLGQFVLFTRYPMGLLHAWVYIDLDNRCLVCPAPGGRMPPAQVPDYRQCPKGDKGVGVDDFVGLRSYRVGDPIKHIHWKTLAREQGIQTKQFGGDRADRRWLDWDSLQGMDTEQRLSALCRGVLDACEKQHEYGLRLPGTEIKPNRGPVHRNNCLASLALFGESV
ncbi:DUF58 domain-containing protein [Solemya velesiana gill symbiont]|uniref:Uncharacterized protein n=1 Tax=Solemya velesiana gill symbiont TaxID=1918948 RepID=A0A1T2KXS0_9GAMM|nr:DUF58 domain-containing protein [Solemya velesiana gill symbiont]OOZ37560.1 hypothetical protein BOW51_01740 [Solemya velesiana gill symbiont]